MEGREVEERRTDLVGCLSVARAEGLCIDRMDVGFEGGVGFVACLRWRGWVLFLSCASRALSESLFVDRAAGIQRDSGRESQH